MENIGITEIKEIPPQPAPEAAGAESPTVQQLQQLAELHDSGALSDQEFEAAKQRVLARD